jgi:hypothetical protein
VNETSLEQIFLRITATAENDLSVVTSATTAIPDPVKTDIVDVGSIKDKNSPHCRNQNGNETVNAGTRQTSSAVQFQPKAQVGGMGVATDRPSDISAVAVPLILRTVPESSRQIISQTFV